MSRPEKLSILIPVYNERYTLSELVARVAAAELPEGCDREIILVDDCSTDGTREVLGHIAERYDRLVRVVHHEVNQGKGAAVRTAIQHATGTLCLIQDADLEYDPNDYKRLLQPILDGDADVVYGSRFLVRDKVRVLFFWHRLGNKMLTLFSNMANDLTLTDMETCYKVVRTEILKSIPIRCNRFGIEPELTAKLAKRQCRIYEVPINYHGRTYQEGKKITWKDGVKALATIIWFRLIDDIYDEKHAHAILHALSNAPHFNRWMADTVRPYVGTNVLEIGAGMGNLSAQFLPREHYAATDIDPMHLAHLENRFATRPNVEVAQVDLARPEDFAPHAGRYDTVICLNVLEHVEDEMTALSNILSALKPGGRAVILVPRNPKLFGSLDEVLGHYRRYLDGELADKCRQAGFEIEKTFTFNRVSVPAWFLNARVFKRTYFSKVQVKMLEITVWLAKLLERILPWSGLSLIAIARKPHTGAAQATNEGESA